MSTGKSDNDRDELVVELLARILGRLDAMEEELDVMAKAATRTPDPKAIDPAILGSVASALQTLDENIANIDTRLGALEQADGSMRAVVRRTIHESLAPVLEHVGATSEWARLEHTGQKGELDRLRRINRTWLWATPSLAFAILIVSALAARLAMNTATGCTALGGKYEATGRGFVDLCFFNAGGWW